MRRDLALLSVTLAVLSGCRTTEQGMLLITRVKSPVTVRAIAVNEPIMRDPNFDANASVAQRDQQFNTDKVDRFPDLANKDPIVVICVSGGGARAARLATHAMAALEAAWKAKHPGSPLIDHIQIWSTVSGGSIYSSWVATVLAGSHTNIRGLGAPPHNDQTFEGLEKSRLVTQDTQYLGAMAAEFYFSPLNFGYAPLLLTFSEWDTVNLFARTHDLLQDGVLPIMPFKDLPPIHPPGAPLGARFFFNSTIAENGRPFVFTGTPIHTIQEDDLEPISDATNPLLRWMGNQPKGRDNVEPLSYATTLEDIGSTPYTFSMSYAALASAAFPFAFNPITLNYYRTLVPEGQSREERQPSPFALSATHQLNLVDGGIYDNTGMTTALDLVDYIGHQGGDHPKHHFFILVIDANTDVSKDVTQIVAPCPKTPIQAGWPLRGIIPGGSTVSEIYSLQKGLTKQDLDNHMDRTRLHNEWYYLDYLEMNIADAPPEMEPGLQKIPTDFVVTQEEDACLSRFVRQWLKADVDLGKYPRLKPKLGDDPSNQAAFIRGIESGSINAPAGADSTQPLPISSVQGAAAK